MKTDILSLTGPCLLRSNWAVCYARAATSSCGLVLTPPLTGGPSAVGAPGPAQWIPAFRGNGDGLQGPSVEMTAPPERSHRRVVVERTHWRKTNGPLLPA